MRSSVLLLLLATACLDKAKPDYDKCVERDHNYDVKGAVAACSAAVAADSKSPAGQAAAKKLFDLQSVDDKLKAEAADKAAREAKIAKDDPDVSPPPTATAAAAATATTVTLTVAPDAGSNGVLAQAQALYDSGDKAGARALLESRVLGAHAKPTRAEGLLLGKICFEQHDRECVLILKRKAR